ncbi:L-lactate permease [Palleronia abyssalis]|uniref:L-lactate permease n=1 Tax=Palleronia abyssalis TaxID=1501240 RepID=A0A2R8C0Y7_9RHOB|nr:L-lactate permease [Palleronia abyssalis]SPJ26084.1 Glycolate permease GlcA [Palleronia abyssalis]
MSALLASTPLGLILIGMVILRRSAILSGAAGLALAISLALTAFEPAEGIVPLLVGVGAEAAHSTATIVWIIFPALGLFEFQKASGAIVRIRDMLASVTEDRRLQAILIAWFFGLFMEGAAGFGTPVALAAPLLVGLGYPPVRAVVLALLGHAAGVSFGAVGTPVLAQVTLSGLPAQDVAMRTASMHAVCAPVLLLIMVRMADDPPLSARMLAWTVFAAASFLVPSVLLAAVVGPELPTLGGALVGAAVFIAVLRRRPSGEAASPRAVLADLAPYVVILMLVLVTRLIAPVQRALADLSLSWSISSEYSGAFQPLYHPGTLLFLGLLLGAIGTGRLRLLTGAVSASIRRLVPVAFALMVMLMLSRLMVHAGMIDSLAAAAASVGPAWPLLSPFVGVLGTFITGSATSSNILFTEFQASTADSVGLSAANLVAAQGFGSAIGNIVAPHNIIAGSATVGLSGREGEVMARTAKPCLIYAALGGLLTFGWLQVAA